MAAINLEEVEDNAVLVRARLNNTVKIQNAINKLREEHIISDEFAKEIIAKYPDAGEGVLDLNCSPRTLKVSFNSEKRSSRKPQRRDRKATVPQKKKSFFGIFSKKGRKKTSTRSYSEFDNSI